MASRLTSAVQGAASGASVGSAITPGLGTTVGAGVGALGGLLMGGETDAERIQREKLEELQRRQELGQLGLTDEEMNVALGQAQGALSQQQQAQRAQQAGLLATTGVGAGAALRAGQEEASQARREMADARQRVEQADLKQKQAEEEQITQLAALEQQRAAQEREALISGIGDLGQQIYIGGQLKSQREAAIELQSKNTEDAAAALVAENKSVRVGQAKETVDSDFEQLFSDGFKQATADIVVDNQVAAPALPAVPPIPGVADAAPAVLDRFEILALKEAGVLSEAAASVPPEIIQKAKDLNMDLEEYLLFLKGIGRGI
tara:strand:+ start:489 stop:1445 length:957 start_codon:yes stop_codon:yes gene_type:complete